MQLVSRSKGLMSDECGKSVRTLRKAPRTTRAHERINKSKVPA